MPFAFTTALAAALTFFGFASKSRADHQEYVVSDYYDEDGEYAYEPAPDCVVDFAPPPPLAYDVPPPPYYGAVWVEPHWVWDGYRWVWVEGYYIAPRPGYVYVEPRWTFSYGVNVFIGGYFYPAHTHLIGWDSYHHYWWHRPSPYHRYFANYRPYYYGDYRHGRYYYRGRDDYRQYNQHRNNDRRDYDARQRGNERGNAGGRDHRERNQAWFGDGFEGRGRDNDRFENRGMMRQPNTPQRQTLPSNAGRGRDFGGGEHRDAMRGGDHQGSFMHGGAAHFMSRGGRR